jgi:mRNA-degrading endonuclease toxin of MazEF toxin-antitoxin module
VRRGEVRWAQHPDWPRRPALVLTRDEAIDRLNEVFVVLATTNIRALPTEVALGMEDEMPRACVLNADHVASLPKGYLGDLIATPGSERLAEVCRALDRATAPTCVLSASLRLEMSRIALQPQIGASLGISCIYGLFVTYPVKP